MKMIVIDAGTSSMRGTVFEDGGKRSFHTVRKYAPDYMADGEVEQDAGQFSGALYGILKEAADKGGNGEPFDAVVLCAQRSSLMAVDEAGAPIMRAIMWQDKRCLSLCEEMERSGTGKLVYRKCGSPVNTVYSGSKMKWLRRNRPLLYKRAYKLLAVPEYLLFLLTGTYITDETYASRSLLMDIQTGRWDETLLSVFEVEEDKLCSIEKPGSIVGYLSKECSAVTGLEEGIPIISAGGDQQCSLVGQRLEAEDMASLTAGTGAFLSRIVKGMEHVESGIIWNRASVPGLYIMECNMLACTAVIDWLQRLFFRKEDNFYAALEDILSKADGAWGGCGAVPYFQGRGTPDFNGEARGLIYGLTLADGREELVTAVVVSLCMEMANQMELLERCGQFGKVLVSGGLAQSGSFLKLLADVTGKVILNSEEKETTTYGAYLIGKMALTGEPPAPVPFEGKAYYPDEAQHEAYRKKRQEMNWFYRQCTEKKEDHHE